MPNMKKITLYDKTFKTYIPFECFVKDIDRVAAQINDDFRDSGEIPLILCTLNGALPFTAEIMMRFDFPCELSSVKVSSYVGTQTTGNVQLKQPITANLKGRTVIIVEDIVESGHTMNFLRNFLKEQGAKDVKICTLFYKPDAFLYKDKFELDYAARIIQNQFIVGFGLDYRELGRNFRDIYILDE